SFCADDRGWDPLPLCLRRVPTPPYEAVQICRVPPFAYLCDDSGHRDYPTTPSIAQAPTARAVASGSYSISLAAKRLVVGGALEQSAWPSAINGHTYEKLTASPVCLVCLER